MRKTLLPLLLVLAALSGCAGLKDLARTAFREPRLVFRSVALGALDLEGATLAFTWDVENPNAIGLDLARAAWQVEVEGTRVAAGDLPAGVAIPANGKAPLAFPVRIRFRDVPGIVSLLGSGRSDLGYKLSGSVGLRTPIGVVDLPMSHQDRVKVPTLPRFAIDGLRVRSVSLSAVGPRLVVAAFARGFLGIYDSSAVFCSFEAGSPRSISWRAKSSGSPWPTAVSP